MKFVIAFTLFVAAFAAEIEVQPVVLPEAPAPFVSGVQVVEELPSAYVPSPIKIAEPIGPIVVVMPVMVAIPEVPTFFVDDVAQPIELPAPIPPQVQDINDALRLRFVDSPLPEEVHEIDDLRVRFVDSPLPEEVQEIDDLRVHFVDSPLPEEVQEIDDLRVRFVDSPLPEAPETVQVSAVKVATPEMMEAKPVVTPIRVVMP